VFKLIKLYENNPCLYDVQLKGISQRKCKKSAIQKMAEELSTTGEHFIYNHVGQLKVMGIWTELLESGGQIDVIYKCKIV